MSGAGWRTWLLASVFGVVCPMTADGQDRASAPRTPAQAGAATATASTPPAGELVPFWLVRPEYPELARSARVQGVVIVALTVAADGRMQSAVIERDIPLLSQVALQAARESGFICRGCTGSLNYRLTYAFAAVDVTGELDGFANSIHELEAARTQVTPAAATLHVLVEALPTTAYPRRPAR